MEPIELKGCRHDILGHYLKAIGLLRVLARCADEEHRDPDAEGWWDLDKACFCIRSEKYPDEKRLSRFISEHYKPTPILAAWKDTLGIQQKDAMNMGFGKEYEMALRYSSTVVKPEKAQEPGKRTAAKAFFDYRNDVAQEHAEWMDAISSSFIAKGRGDNPLWIAKGYAGRGHVFHTHWGYVLDLLGKARAEQEGDAQANKGKKMTKRETLLDAVDKYVHASLFGDSQGVRLKAGSGTPYFPDAIKSYNIGSGWKEEKNPFNPLDYVLAVEGAYAMRGSVGKHLAMNARRFASYPFVFDTCEEAVDDGGKVQGTSMALWFPLWDRRTTFDELYSFIGDAQARLPGREARFSVEFVRALHAQGVDAGLKGWQEFRFRMRSSRVPWVTTGRYLEAGYRNEAILLNKALRPVDESGFLDQFDIHKETSGKVSSGSPHPVRAEIIAAMEEAFMEPNAANAMALLETVFKACRRITTSKSFREKLRGGPTFFAPLPMDDWMQVLKELEEVPEFRIARALASMAGGEKQAYGSYPDVLPMLGSILPLKKGANGRWYLPDGQQERNYQAVWTGTDIGHDLAAVLRRRYMDSLKEDRPALRAVHRARLKDVIDFLNGDLDDQLILRWTESLSLIGWHFSKFEKVDPDDESHLVEERTEDEYEAEELPPVPLAYAALRTLLELECEWQGNDHAHWKKRRSQTPFAWLAQRSASTLPMAVSEALRWIAIWGVPYDKEARNAGQRISGSHVVRIDPNGWQASDADLLGARLAAAVCIPVDFRDRWHLHRAVTLPQVARRTHTTT